MNWYKYSQNIEEILSRIHERGPEGSFLDEEKLRKSYGDEEALKIIESIKQHEQTKDTYWNNTMKDYYRRKAFINEFGWSVPTQKAIEEIKQFTGTDTVLEVGSGFGLWAHLLQQSGVQVIPTDAFVPMDKLHDPQTHSFTQVEKLKALDAVSQYATSNTLMLVWPLYDDPMAYMALKNFKGNKVIYIGESGGGCTGDDNFCKLLNEEWKIVKHIDIPQWKDIHDQIYLYTRL